MVETNENGLYDFTISVKEKELCLLMIAKILAQAEKVEDQGEPAIIAISSLAEKILDSIKVEDLELTREEVVALNGVDTMIGAILTGKDPMDLAKERYGK